MVWRARFSQYYTSLGRLRAVFLSRPVCAPLWLGKFTRNKTRERERQPLSDRAPLAIIKPLGRWLRARWLPHPRPRLSRSADFKSNVIRRHRESRGAKSEAKARSRPSSMRRRRRRRRRRRHGMKWIWTASASDDADDDDDDDDDYDYGDHGRA